jgi:GTP-binding protein Era
MNNNHANFQTGFIAIVGRPNVGKSTLLNNFVGQKVSITSRKAQTTRHRINGILTDKQSQFIFVDTPGFQMQHTNRLNSMMNRVVTQSLKEVDVVLFIIEALHFDDRDKLILKLLPNNKPVILVINKIDHVADKKLLLPFLEEMAKCFAFDSMVPISAEKKIQLPNLLDSIRPHLPQGVPLYDEEDITDRNERFVAAELVREKLFRLMGDEVTEDEIDAGWILNKEGDQRGSLKIKSVFQRAQNLPIGDLTDGTSNTVQIKKKSYPVFRFSLTAPSPAGPIPIPYPNTGGDFDKTKKPG